LKPVTIIAHAGLSWLLAGTARAAVDVELDVPPSTIANALKEQIGKAMAAQSLGWRPGATKPVALSSGDAQRVHARLDMVHNPKAATPVPVSIELDVLFDCDADGISITIDRTEVNGGTGAVADAIEKAGNAMIATATKPMTTALWKSLKMVDKLPGNHNRVCPNFQISSAGGLRAQLDFEDGCINGYKLTTPCPKGYKGPFDKKLVCTNGNLITYDGTCKWDDTVDPPPPPGGNQP
jgi:hypothetical protein